MTKTNTITELTGDLYGDVAAVEAMYAKLGAVTKWEVIEDGQTIYCSADYADAESAYYDATSKTAGTVALVSTYESGESFAQLESTPEDREQADSDLSFFFC